MKAVIRTSLLIMVSVVLWFIFPENALADQWGDFMYQVVGDEVTITKYIGSGGDVTIPETINGKCVTRIGNSAFRNCSFLVTVIIPENVISIGELSFQNCSNLTNINIPDSVINIEGYAFDGCISLTNITIPNSVINIGEYAFQCCSSLAEIVIPDSVTSIGQHTFCGCSSLVRIVISNSITSIGEMTFASCSSLKSIIIPNNITSIGLSAFDDCINLESVILSNNLINIGKDAFCDCSSLTSIIIPNSVTSIGDYAFGWCINLSNIKLSENIANIGNGAFGFCTSLTSITLPNSVINVGDHAFYCCKNLEKAIFRGGKPELGTAVFSSTTSAFIIYYSVLYADTWRYSGYATQAYCIATIYPQNGDENKQILTEVNNGYILAPTAPVNSGSTFVGWYKEPSCINVWDFNSDYITSDIELYAKWIPYRLYSVTFDSQGGSSLTSVTADYNTTITEPSEPTQEGYTFIGWYKEAACTNAWVFASDTIPAHDTTLYAKWTINEYTISFDSQGGSMVGDVEADYNSTIIAPPAPTRIGYTFDGWYKEAACSNAWVFATDKIPAHDITLYAKWVINQYTVSFNSQGGSAVGDIEADYNSTIIALPAPKRIGYTFDGWYKEAACTNAWVFTTDTIPAHDITLYAKWMINQHTVSFNSQGGTTIADLDADYNSKITAPTVPTRTGYTFSGWYQEAACTNAWVFTADTIPAHDITLYAKWTINQYTVSFDSQGGSAVGDIEAYFDSSITAPAAPVRTGYTFGGWYKEAACTNAWVFATDAIPAHDIILFANWTINEYTVIFDSRGGSAVGDINADYNSKITAPTAPTRTGYTFGGWYKEAACTNAWVFTTDTISARDMTLYAKWTINQYTVSFNSLGGSSVGDLEANYNSKITAPTAPTRTGNTFIGWYKEAACTSAWVFASDTIPANDITLYAKWMINTYTVTFNSQGGSAVAPKTAGYDTTITAPTQPTRTGYTFCSWYKEAACTNVWSFANDHVTADVTLYAKWVSTTPTGLKAASASYISVMISWISVPGASGYQVYRATSSTGTYTLAGTVTGTSFTNTGLTTGTTYYFKVRSYAGVTKVYSAFSTVASAKPVPAAPASPKASPVTYNSIKVTWTAVSGASKYEVYRATSSTGSYTLLTTTSYTYYTNTSVNTGSAYYYKVRAYRLVGSTKVYGTFSAVVSARTVLSTPTSVKAARALSTSIKIIWAAVAGATKYEIWRSTSSTGTYTLLTTTGSAYYTNAGLVTGRYYYYKVRAYRLIGTTKVYSGFSAVVYAKP